MLSAPFITGSTRYSPEQLVPVFAARIGEPVSRRLLDSIEAEIQDLYRRDGYMPPTLVTLDREIASSTPRIHVFEASIDEVAVRGDAGPYTQQIMNRASELRHGLVDRKRAQDLVAALNRLPGLKVRASFEPHGTQSNSLRLVLASQYRPIEGVVNVSNRGTDEIGRTLISGRVTFNGFAGSAVSLTGATSSETDRYQFVGASAERAFSGLRARLDVGGTNADLTDRYEYRSQRARLQLIANGWQTGRTQWQPFIGFSARDARGAYPDRIASDVNTRAGEAGVIALHSGDSMSAYARTGFMRGLDVFGASSYVSYGDAPDLQFSKTSLDFSLVKVVAPNWQARIDFEGQYSDSTLPGSERFTFGGAFLGRAFDPAELVGDSGAAIGVQVEKLQRWQTRWLTRSSVYLHSDYGYARDSGTGDDAGSLSGGLKLTFTSLLASLELSTPTHRAETHMRGVHTRGVHTRGDVRAFAQVQISF